MNLTEYLNLIPSANRPQPIFVSTISVSLAACIDVQDLLTSMIPLFDVDVAVGDQEDIVGEWVGITRDVNIPIAGIYFSWDGTDPTIGWDFGSWEPSVVPSAITELPDDAYRTLLRAKIAANRWDGTTEGAYSIWEAVFPQFEILIQDNQDMTYDLAVVGGVVDSFTVALLTEGYLPLKPEGVLIAAYYFSVDTGPVFAWDVEAGLLAGWDEGSWVREVAPA